MIVVRVVWAVLGLLGATLRRRSALPVLAWAALSCWCCSFFLFMVLHLLQLQPQPQPQPPAMLGLRLQKAHPPPHARPNGIRFPAQTSQENTITSTRSGEHRPMMCGLWDITV